MAGRLGLVGAAASMIGLASATAGGAANPLAAYQWQSRILLVIAADAGDPKLARQRDIFHALEAGAQERDLKLVEAVGASPQADSLRKRFDMDNGRFRAILIGKDGGDKLSSDEPLGAEQLFPLIDSMPMRQQEMRRRS